MGHIWEHGEYLWSRVNDLFKKYGFGLEMKGFPCCKTFAATPEAKGGEQGAFMRACFGNGVSLYGVSYVNFSHQYSDLDETLQRMEQALISITK